jgi:hypothetical protein
MRRIFFIFILLSCALGENSYGQSNRPKIPNGSIKGPVKILVSKTYYGQNPAELEKKVKKGIAQRIDTLWYDAMGNNIRRIYYSDTDTQERTYRFQYHDGQLIRHEYGRTVSNLRYDANKKLIYEETYEVWNGAITTRYHRAHYEYDRQGRLKRQVDTSYDEQWLSTSFIYDSVPRFTIKIDSAFARYGLTVASYGLRRRTISYLSDSVNAQSHSHTWNQSGELTNRSSWTFNSRKQLTASVSYDFSYRQVYDSYIKDSLLVKKTESTYNSEGRMISDIINEGGMVTESIFEYDAKENLVSYLFTNDALSYKVLERYTYDEKNNLTARIVQQMGQPEQKEEWSNHDKYGSPTVHRSTDQGSPDITLVKSVIIYFTE